MMQPCQWQWPWLSKWHRQLQLACVAYCATTATAAAYACDDSASGFDTTANATIGSSGAEATTVGFGTDKCGAGKGREPAFPLLTLAQARAICCNHSWFGLGR